ncbi:hypothetical protein [Nocardioides sp.]|uniref:hypothetical protein n=1 Tax=Nocardioides sp. TaxID=35761 RepID=UPI001A26EB7C|nr:hypothetical protein [Nocardioides sp.]MBJ7358456.1 hypothetical protein [Nocardioides sp.]
MTGAAAHALWWAAPARLLRAPGWFGLMVVAATLLVASVVAPPLFASTARATALESALDATASNPYGPESGDLRVAWNAVLTPEADAGVLDRLDALTAYGPPVLGAAGTAQTPSVQPVAVAGDQQEVSVLWYRDGAVQALADDLGGDPEADGVWLAADVADRLGLAVGDRVRIGLFAMLSESRTLAPTVLLGTYETAPGSSLPEQLAGLPDADRWYLPTYPDRPGLETPLAIAARPTFDRLVLEVGEAPLFTADLRLDPDVTPDSASRASDEIAAFGKDAYDQSTLLSTQLRSGEPDAAEVSLSPGLPQLVEDADTTATSARGQVRPYAIGGQALAALLLVAAWVVVGLNRRREQLLGSGVGLRPLELATLGALEVAPVCLLAFPAGVGLAGLGILTAGPPDAAGLTISSDDLVRGGVAGLAALLLVAGTAAATALATDRLGQLSRLGRRRRSLPWGMALLAGTAVVTGSVVTLDTEDRSGSPLTMLFPLLVAATVALLVARGTGWLRGRLRLPSRPGSPRWLAGRRTGPVVREVTGLTAVVALALGLFGYTLTVSRGVDQGVADKTAALVGARTTYAVADDLRGSERSVSTPPVDGTTVVWGRGVSLPPTFGEGPLMAIDTRTFAGVADWGASGELDPARALLPRLDVETRGIPVILAGDTDLAVGDEATMDFSSEFSVPIKVIGVVDAFPGSEASNGTVTVVASRRMLFPLLPPTVDPQLPGASATDAGAFASLVWSNDPPATLRAAFERAGLATDGEVRTSEQARIVNELVASTWVASYVLALGGVVLVLALGAGIVLVLRLAARDTVSDVVLRRMGYDAGQLARARAWEVGYAAATAIVAAALATAVLVLAPSSIDALAGIPPVSRPRPGVPEVLALFGTVGLLVLLALLSGTALARRRPAAEVLRAGG